MQTMRATPVHDFFADNGHIRADGLMVHDMYLFAASQCPLVRAAGAQ